MAAGCSGGTDAARQASPPPDDATGGDPTGREVGSPTEEADARDESLEGETFTLNQRLPVPPRFEAAYQREAPIVIEFFQQGQDPYYPQGLEVDEMVNDDLTALRDDYPQVEFFTYDIDNPGEAETGEDLRRGEYGTLAVQMRVGYTPFVAMLAPRGQGYIVENLYQGYVGREVLDQALYELARTEAQRNASYVPLDLRRVELTETGDEVEYFSVTNRGDEEVNLSSFSLNEVDPETGEVDGSAEGLRIGAGVSIAPGQTVSIGREPRIVDANGREVAGAFSGGESLMIEPGDLIALFDGGGAVVDTVTV